jgi:PKD repeat protein
MKIFKNYFLPVLIVMLAIVWTGCNKDDDDEQVVAAFTFQLSENPGEVVFTNQSQNADVYTWTFGDATNSTMINPVHVYDENGSFIVVLQAQGSAGSSSVQDTVVVDNIP